MNEQAPRGLGTGGKHLWHAIAKKYDLRPDELRTLEDSCREADLIDEMTREQKDKDKTVKGSMGQIVAAPLISELRQHRATLNTMLRSLKLPEVDAGALAAEAERKAGESERKRAAAVSRWTRETPA
jgi:hypothetical protein